MKFSQIQNLSMQMLFVQFSHNFTSTKSIIKRNEDILHSQVRLIIGFDLNIKFLLGMMTGDDDKHAGKWDPLSTVVKSGLESGPIVLFNTSQQGEGDILVLSPFSQFMASSISEKDHILEYGVLGSILSIPSNYNHSLIVFYSSKGINEGIRDWGQTMQQAYTIDRMNFVSMITPSIILVIIQTMVLIIIIIQKRKRTTNKQCWIQFIKFLFHFIISRLIHGGIIKV